VGLTSAFDRRLLLSGSLLVCAVGHLASAFAPNYATLLGIRAVMMVAVVIFTPLAAGAVTSIVPAPRRSTAISYVFLGWSMSIAFGLLIVGFVASHFGWRAAYGTASAGGFACFVLVATCVPKNLKSEPVRLATWGVLARNRLIVLLLVLAVLQTSSLFLIITFLGPLLTQLAGARPDMVGAFFGILGIAGVAGSVIATGIVGRIGATRASLLCILSMLTGLVVWTLGTGSLAVMAASLLAMGLGFNALNSMQQARLVGAAPSYAGAVVSLNTSTIYLGQAAGSALGGAMFANGLMAWIGATATAVMVAALVVLWVTWERRT
jgi:predicted MFS family arabinose efflux permease